jgi:hypothetical protein
MTYDTARRNRQLPHREDKLLDKWDRLKRSPGPLYQKHMVLPMAFWFSALYGAASCPLADTYLHQFNYDKQQTRLFAANMQEPMPCYASL